MATVQTLPTPTDIKNLIDPLDKTANLSGFQRAHIIGEDFAERPQLAWFRKILGNSGQNAGINGVLAPQAQRGGALLGVAVHRSDHVDAFDSLFFDANPITGRASNKWMNINSQLLEAELRRDLGNPNFDIYNEAQINSLDPADPRISATMIKYSNKAAAFLDFSKTLFMHQDVLNKMGYPELKSLALNGQDVRFSDNQAVTDYINTAIAGRGLIPPPGRLQATLRYLPRCG